MELGGTAGLDADTVAEAVLALKLPPDDAAQTPSPLLDALRAAQRAIREVKEAPSAVPTNGTREWHHERACPSVRQRASASA